MLMKYSFHPIIFAISITCEQGGKEMFLECFRRKWEKYTDEIKFEVKMCG